MYNLRQFYFLFQTRLNKIKQIIYKFIVSQFSKKMLIFVRQANGNGFTLEVQGTSPVKTLLEVISDFNFEDSQNYKIYFKGQIIQSLDITFQESNVKQNDILHLKKNDKINQKQSHINLKVFYNNETYSFRINKQQTVSKLKYKIYYTINVHPKEQCLVFRGRKLQSNITLLEQNIQNDALISLVYMQSKQPPIKLNECRINGQRQLLQSITSLKSKKKLSVSTKTSLYRSDSIGSKKNQGYNSPQVQVKHYRQFLDPSIQTQLQMQIDRVMYNLIQPSTLQMNNKQRTTKETNRPRGSCMIASLKQDQQFTFLCPYKIQQKQMQCLSQTEGDIDSLYKKLNLHHNDLFQSLDFSQANNIHCGNPLPCLRENGVQSESTPTL